MKLIFLAVLLTMLWVAVRGFGRKRARPRSPRFAPDRYDVSLLAARLGWDEEELRAFQPSYASRLIAKRGPYRGSGRKRRLDVPNASTLEVQKRILRRILVRLRVHECCQGFEKGHSVAKNASVHAYQAVVLKMDIRSFFENTKEERVQSYFRFIGWDADAADVLTRLTTWQGGLPQGAPTSPALSNRLNFGLDHSIHWVAQHRRGTYTRYADDITISFPLDYPRKIRGVVQEVRRIAKYYGYEIHKKRKLRIMRRHHSQQVTGLVVNDGVRVPRKTRRWLRAVEHRLQTQGTASLTPEQLAGWKAYLMHVDTVREQSDAELKATVETAWERSRHSITYAAELLGISTAKFKTYMKAFGIWDPSKAR